MNETITVPGAESASDGEGACCPPGGATTVRSLALAALAEGEAAGALSDRLKALADPTRLRMLALLAAREAPLCVCEITERFPLRQPTISHHLRLLREAGLVDCEKRGVWAYYEATDVGRHAAEVALALL